MAADAAIKIDIATEFTGKKAFAKAESATTTLTKSVRNLAGAFGLAFGARTLARYSQQAVKAFAADDKAARVLAGTLKNLGLSYAATDVASFIDSLEKQFGVVDDLLRPAYQRLLTQTSDYRLAQDLLRTSLDLSAQSGKDVLTVSSDLGKAFAGNTRGLIKYGLGFTKAELAAASFDDVLARIAQVSSGQAALAADTISGKLAKIDAAAQRASETIGGALVDSFAQLAGNGDIDKAIAKFDDFIKNATNIFKLSTGALTLGELTKGKEFGFDLRKGLTLTDIKTSSNRSASPAGRGLAAIADKKARDAINKNTTAFKANTASVKAKTEVDKLSAKFDLDRIGLYAALATATTEEEKARIKAKIAIVEQNEAGAKALNALSTAAFNAATSTSLMTASQVALANALGASLGARLGTGRSELDLGSTGGTTTGSMPMTNIPAAMAGGSAEVFNAISGTYMPHGMANQFVANVTVSAGTITNEQGVVDVVQQALQEINARGWSQFKAGGLVAL
jgi:hypothetical protein